MKDVGQQQQQQQQQVESIRICTPRESFGKQEWKKTPANTLMPLTQVNIIEEAF